MAWYNNLPSKTWSGTKELAGKAVSRDTLRGLGKAGLVAGAVVAGTAVLGFLASSFRKDRSPAKHAPEPEIVPSPALQPEHGGPAEGYGTKQWQNYVEAGRAGQRIGGSLNPRMNIGEAEDLGTIRSR